MFSGSALSTSRNVASACSISFFCSCSPAWSMSVLLRSCENAKAG